MKSFFKFLFSKDGKSSVIASLATAAALCGVFSSDPKTKEKFVAAAVILSGGTGFVTADSKTKATRISDEAGKQ